MSAIERLTVTVPAEVATAVREAVAAGTYASASDVVRDALRAWVQANTAEGRDSDALRREIRAGLDSGPPIPAEEVFAELRARYASKD